MVDAVQTFSDLANWHSHIHAIVAEAEIHCLDFNQFLPIPEEGRTNGKTLDWCWDNSDTKWNCWDIDFTRNSDSSAEYFFNTAWNPPLSVVEAMGEQFPMLRFSFVYGEPLGGFEGEWKCELNGLLGPEATSLQGLKALYPTRILRRG